METQPTPTDQKKAIRFEDFIKADIRICKILSVEKVPDTDKLYSLSIDTGMDIRTVVSAIADKVSSGDLLSKNIPFILNLPPRTIKGIESNGMILIGGKDDMLFSLTSDDNSTGAKVI